MAWLAFFVTLALVGGIGIVVNVNRLRFDRRVADEMRTLAGRPRTEEIARAFLIPAATMDGVPGDIVSAQPGNPVRCLPKLLQSNGQRGGTGISRSLPT